MTPNLMVTMLGGVAQAGRRHAHLLLLSILLQLSVNGEFYDDPSDRWQLLPLSFCVEIVMSLCCREVTKKTCNVILIGLDHYLKLSLIDSSMYSCAEWWCKVAPFMIWNRIWWMLSTTNLYPTDRAI